MDRFKTARDAFYDTGGFYVEIPKISYLKTRLSEQIFENKAPFTTVIGYPGVGKTLLLKKVLENARNKEKAIFLDVPVADAEELLRKVAEATTIELPESGSVHAMTAYLTTALKDDYFIIIVDEAQSYSSELLEFIRMLSDKKVFKFVIVMHKIKKDSLIMQEHFKSRLWNIVEIEPLNKKECAEYIEKSFLLHNLFDVANMFRKRNYTFIYSATKGNIRKINMLLYKIFDIADFYYNNLPHSVKGDSGLQKITEMAALDLRLVGA